MHLVVFGLSITSSWGNGHATLWRALVRALAERGHHTTFFERQMPWYVAHRDLESIAGATLELYDEWPEARARQAVDAADAVIVTSYCPDARAASALPGGDLRVFYDLDTPVTLARLDLGHEVPYLPEDGLGPFDLVLSFTGGDALRALRDRLGARRVHPLYGSVDVDAYVPGRREARFAGLFSYLGTYAADRQPALQRLFLDVAGRRPADQFVLGGSQYPPEFAPPPNVVHITHVEPRAHPDFYASSAWTLNITRGAMARMGYCPSGRLFEAAACGAAIVSDDWPGFDTFFAPGLEVVVVAAAEQVEAALAMPDAERRRLGEAARARVLAEHTARHRAAELEQLLRGATRGFAALAGA